MEACLAASPRASRRCTPSPSSTPTRRARAPPTARPGPLHGLPIGVKDVLDTADMPSEYGSPIWRGWRPRADAAAVAWARAAGARRDRQDRHHRVRHPQAGPDRQPAQPGPHAGRISAAARPPAWRTCFFPFAFGTQTAGSVIRPAAYCGVVGYKPSFGMISRFGMKLMADSLDTVGVMARTVADCALLAGAVSGRDLGDPDARPERRAAHRHLPLPAWDTAAPGNPRPARPRRRRARRAGAAVHRPRAAGRLRRADRRRIRSS